ncbi:MAG: trans-sulfuration enzyme family protein, partial [Chloroflexota bacterium]
MANHPMQRGADGAEARAGSSLATRAVHSGERPPRPDFTPTAMPIYPASAFIYDDTNIQDAVFGNEREGYVYSRYGNPTVRAFEQAITALEGTEDAIAFASGVGAVYAAIMLDAKVGDTVVAAPNVYGATYATLSRIAPEHGINVRFCDVQDLVELERVVREVKPTLVVCETISNPLMRVSNIPEVTRIAHAAGAKVMVDNTFASPMLVNPARFGVDSVVHSGTKYIGGHGDATGGVIAASSERIAALRENNKLVGAVLSGFDAWLLLRGIKTLPL